MLAILICASLSYHVLLPKCVPSLPRFAPPPLPQPHLTLPLLCRFVLDSRGESLRWNAFTCAGCAQGQPMLQLPRTTTLFAAPLRNLCYHTVKNFYSTVFASGSGLGEQLVASCCFAFASTTKQLARPPVSAASVHPSMHPSSVLVLSSFQIHTKCASCFFFHPSRLLLCHLPLPRQYLLLKRYQDPPLFDTKQSISDPSRPASDVLCGIK